jgi:hypothetical protein
MIAKKEIESYAKLLIEFSINYLQNKISSEAYVANVNTINFCLHETKKMGKK